jgi:hypothetical protein
LTKIAYLITHPQLGTQVLANPGETPTQALARYATVLTFDPSDQPATYPLNPRWTQLYTTDQLRGMHGIVSVLNDPDTQEQIPVDDYIANLPKYLDERKQPLPADVW